MNILITGAGKGIGYETALTLAGRGNHKIIAVSRNTNIWKKKPVNGVIPLSLDLVSKDSEKILTSFAEKHLEYVDILINNAGQLVSKPFSEQTSEDFDLQFNVNVKSVFFSIQSLLPFMHPGSHIVNISSMGGFQGSKKFPGLSLYSASKAALASLTECLAAELEGYGISVNCLALGSVQTEMLRKAFPTYKAPLKPEEIAEFIVYFAMNGNRYFNGKILPVSLSNP
jgi:NAD(P)-dependent dehydrogenase (short-subunit alcohol dehydrogenase family)